MADRLNDLPTHDQNDRASDADGTAGRFAFLRRPAKPRKDQNDLAPPKAIEPDAPQYLPDTVARRAALTANVPWPSGADQTYHQVRAHFDPAYYVAMHDDLAQTHETFDLVRHYIRAGDAEGRSPNPHFSPRAYRRRYGDTLKDGTNAYHHWVTKGRNAGLIGHPMPRFKQMAKVLGMDPAACQEKLIALKNDVRARLEHGALGEMVQKAAAFDPLISRTWPRALRPNVQPFHTVEAAHRLLAIQALQDAAQFRRAKAVVCVDGPRAGSNSRLEGHVVHALAALYGGENVVFISLDDASAIPAHKYPQGVRLINVAALAGTLREDHRERVVLEFLRSLRAHAVFNVNSTVLWKLQTTYFKIMKTDVPVVGCFLCNDKSVFGTWGGFPAQHFYRHFANMKAVCTDSHALRSALIDQFMVPSDNQNRIHVLEAPVDPDIAVVPFPPAQGARPQLFWAGRLDRQKRLDLVYEIARQMPQLDIRIWGQTTADGPDPDIERPKNAILEGAYTRFEDLPLAQADAWLYTSEWDGVPSILLEAAMTGLPIIGSLVGGTGEVLKEGLSWPVSPIDDVSVYVAAINNILADPESARKKARSLRRLLAAQRTQSHYQNLVASVMEGVDHA